MEEQTIWKPEYGEVVVYTLGKSQPKMFVFGVENIGGFYLAVLGSSEKELRIGGIMGSQYHKSICRAASEEEVNEYIELVKKSKHTSQNLINILTERKYL